MPDLQIRFSTDKTVAYIDLPEKSLLRPSMNVLQMLLQRHKITQGVDSEVVQGIVNGTLIDGNAAVATGKPPREGTAGYLEWCVDLTPIGKPEVLSSGKVDFKALRSDVNVETGDQIAKVHREEPGIPGITVCAETILPQTLPEFDIVVGEGLTAEGELLIASRSGAVKFDGKTIEVCNHRVVKGDIDYGTGNIEFNGMLTVEGSVRSGFEIDVTGDVFISGDIEDAEVISGGSVVVKGGAVGTTRGSIRCSGSLSVKHVSNFTITAGSDVVINEDALHTEITSDGTISLKNVVGGSVTGMNIIAGTVGSPAGITTLLDITRTGQLVKERYQLLKQFGALMTERKITCDSIYAHVRNSLSAGGALTLQDEQKLADLKKTVADSVCSAGKVKDRLGFIENIEKCDREVYLKIGKAFPGTQIRYTGHETIVDKEEQNILVKTGGG